MSVDQDDVYGDGEAIIDEGHGGQVSTAEPKGAASRASPTFEDAVDKQSELLNGSSGPVSPPGHTVDVQYPSGHIGLGMGSGGVFIVRFRGGPPQLEASQVPPRFGSAGTLAADTVLARDKSKIALRRAEHVPVRPLRSERARMVRRSLCSDAGDGASRSCVTERVRECRRDLFVGAVERQVQPVRTVVLRSGIVCQLPQAPGVCSPTNPLRDTGRVIAELVGPA
jgi:hypothetical protein